MPTVRPHSGELGCGNLRAARASRGAARPLANIDSRKKHDRGALLAERPEIDEHETSQRAQFAPMAMSPQLPAATVTWARGNRQVRSSDAGRRAGRLEQTALSADRRTEGSRAARDVVSQGRRLSCSLRADHSPAAEPICDAQEGSRVAQLRSLRLELGRPRKAQTPRSRAPLSMSLTTRPKQWRPSMTPGAVPALRNSPRPTPRDATDAARRAIPRRVLGTEACLVSGAYRFERAAAAEYLAVAQRLCGGTLCAVHPPVEPAPTASSRAEATAPAHPAVDAGRADVAGESSVSGLSPQAAGVPGHHGRRGAKKKFK